MFETTSQYHSLYNDCTHACLMSCHANSSCVSFADQLPRYQKSASSATSISAPSCHESPAMISDVFFVRINGFMILREIPPENHGLYHQLLLLLVSFPSNQPSSYVIVPYIVPAWIFNFPICSCFNRQKNRMEIHHLHPWKPWKITHQLHLQMHHLGVRHIGHGTNQVLRGTQKAYEKSRWYDNV